MDILIITKKKDDKYEIEDNVYGKVMDIVYKHMEYVSAKIIPSDHYKKI